MSLFLSLLILLAPIAGGAEEPEAKPEVSEAAKAEADRLSGDIRSLALCRGDFFAEIIVPDWP